MTRPTDPEHLAGDDDRQGTTAGGHGDTEVGRGRTSVLVGLGVVSSLLLAGAWLLPLWQATLHAPQYPGGLTTVAYGSKVTGDLDEINALNHYVGLGVFDPSDVPEMRLWPLALVVAFVAVLVGLVVRRGWPRRLALTYLWTLPVGVLTATQYRLHEFGQDVQPGAAFRMEPFTPWVIGKTTVWNFETWAWPGLGLLALVAAAAVVTFGPRLLGRGRRGVEPDASDGPGDTGVDAGRASVVALLVAALALPGATVLASPAAAADHDHGDHDAAPHDHGAHEPGHVGEGPPQPGIGPEHHPAMPQVIEHPPAGDLADLLDTVEPGGTLRLPPGTYTGPVVIDRPVTIDGEGLPIVQGDGTGTVITVRADGTEIRGIVVRGSGPGPNDNPAAIRVEADDVTVEGVVVQDSYMGLAVDSAAAVKLIGNHIHGRADAPIVDDGHAVEHEAVDEPDASGHGAHDPGAHDHHAAAASAGVGSGGPRGDGVWLHDVDHVLVRDNHVMGVRDGVYVSFGSGALLDGNHLHGSRYAVHTMFARDLTLVQNHATGNLSGAVLMYGENALLLRNHIENNTSRSTGFGTILKDLTGVEAVQNLFVDNRIAVHLDGPTDATFTANTIARSDIGLQAHSSATGVFSGNSFVQNAIQVLPLGARLDGIAWAADGFGNHWDTYRGYDARGEGKGAVAHTEGGAVDRLLARNPELLAIAGSPGMRLLRSVEERWGTRDPALVDELPLTRAVSPPLPSTSVPDAQPLALALGLALVLPGLVLVVNRPRRRLAATRRSPRAVHA